MSEQIREFVAAIARYEHKVARFNPILVWAYQHLETDLACELERLLCDAANQQATDAAAALDARVAAVSPPSVRDVRALIEQWREKAASLRNDAVTQQEGGAYEAAAYERGKADARMLDAKELDTLIGSAPQEQDWQPISTAPKDGTWILIGAPGAVRGSQWVDVPASALLPEGIHCWSAGWLITGRDRNFQPTHWRPLPPPPVAAVDPLRGPQPGDPT